MSTDLFHKENQRRLLAIDQCLRRYETGMSRDMLLTTLKAQGFDVSLRTLHRDLDLLRSLKAPLGNKVIPAADGTLVYHWFYRDRSWTLSQLKLTDGVLFSLLIAQRVMEQYKGLPLADDLRLAFNEIATTLNRKISISHDSLIPIRFSSEQPVAIAPEVWGAVARATMRHHQLQITYTKRWGDTTNPDTRCVEPYHIVNLQGTWYLLATASLTNTNLRQYDLTRIIKAKMLSTKFELPADFDIDRLLSIAFGKFIGDPDNVEEVHVRFKGSAATMAMSQQFSEKEKKKVLKNGDIDLRFYVSAAGPIPFYNIKSWILSWGADVEVLAPESLRILVRDEIKVLAAREDQRAEAGCFPTPVAKVTETETPNSGQDHA